MTYLYKNFAETTLAVELLAAGTSMTIVSGDLDLFPELVDGSSMLLTLFDGISAPEIVLVTAMTENVFTITRAQEDTSAAHWNVGTVVRLAPTAGQFQEFWNALGGNGVLLITSANDDTAFTDWDRRRGAAQITTAASALEVALPTTATLYDEVLCTKMDVGAGTATLKQGATTIATLTAQYDWKLLRWSGTSWVVVAGTTVGPTGADGADGADGDDGADGYTILNGIAVPTTEGVNGDFYIKDPTTAPVLYGPKTAGAWGAGVSLVGPSGAGSGDMLKADNLTGLADLGVSRTNLGLGGAAVLSVGTTAGTVAAGDDSRFSGLTVLGISTDKTLALTDAGVLQRHTSATAHAVTIPPNSSVAFAIGVIIPVRAFGAGVVTLTRGSGVALREAGSGTDTDVVLYPYDYRILLKEDTDSWVLL